MKKGFIVLYAILILVVFMQAQVDATAQGDSEFETKDFLLDDGTLTYRGWMQTEQPSSSNPYGVEGLLNVSITAYASVRSLSDEIVRFEVSMYFNAQECYQKRQGTEYTPDSDGIRYYDSELDFIGTDDMQYEYEGNVNKKDGRYSLFHAPQGASYYSVAAYFDSVFVYEWIATLPVPFPEAGEQNGFFVHNISEWSIGTDYHKDYTVSGESTYGSYETWVLEPKSNLAGMDVFEDRIEWEKTSGLFLQQDSRFVETNEFDFEYHLRATEYEDMILIPAPAVVDPLMTGIGGFAVVGIIAIVILYKRQKDSHSQVVLPPGF